MLTIRAATIADVPLLNTLVHELAEYDRVSHEAVVTEEDLARDGFWSSSEISRGNRGMGREVAGYVLFFEFYSTFQGRAGLFLDDIFVRPAFRHRGIGRALLDHVAGSRGTRSFSACDGKCWIGISPRSSSTAASARYSSMNGSQPASLATLWKPPQGKPPNSPKPK